MDMNNQPASIFNHVIGPVMAGPSSSHTAGPARIGKLAGQLLNGQLRKVSFVFEPNGSFAATYRGQKSDFGFVGGLLGWDPGDDRLSDAFNEAQKRGLEIDFAIEKFSAQHPNTVKIKLENISGATRALTAISVGGGMVEIIEIDGFPVSLAGDFYETLIYIEQDCRETLKTVAEIFARLGEIIAVHHCLSGDRLNLINIKTSSPVADRVLQEVKACLPAAEIIRVDPVLPVLSFRDCAVPFRTAKELLDLTKMKNCALWEAAALYESMRSGWPVSRVLEEMSQVRMIMKKSIQNGLAGDFEMEGYLGRSAAQIERNINSKKHIPTGILDQATPWAVAVMESNSAMGVVVAAPTAGSCGIIPAALFSTAEMLDIDEEEQVKALLVAGIIGVIISEQATFAAEVCGCQAECGSSSSMAAAALVSLVGGTAEEAVNAAGIALQNLLGLICDPVGSLVQIPCFNRNVMGAANAAVSANMAMGGFDPVIPLDEVIQAMYAVGKMLPRELRCTGLGGLCSTDKGKELSKTLTGCGDKSRYTKG